MDGWEESERGGSREVKEAMVVEKVREARKRTEKQEEENK